MNILLRVHLCMGVYVLVCARVFVYVFYICDCVWGLGWGEGGVEMGRHVCAKYRCTDR